MKAKDEVHYLRRFPQTIRSYQSATAYLLNDDLAMNMTGITTPEKGTSVTIVPFDDYVRRVGSYTIKYLDFECLIEYDYKYENNGIQQAKTCIMKFTPPIPSQYLADMLEKYVKE